MKKFFLFAAAAAFAAAANAQVLQLNAEDFGFGSDAVDCEEGTVWGTTDFGTFRNAFTTQHKAVDCKNNNYNQVVFNGTDIVLTKGGIQGQDNPKDADGANPGISLSEPIQGAVVKFVAEKDGYVYIVSKLSSNKNYYVYEEGTAIGFTLAMQVEAEGLPELLTYTAVGDPEYNYLEDNTWTDWPENVYYNKILGQEKPGDIKKNGLGFISFKCYAGCEYLIGAGGSKISWSGAYCCDAPATSVVLQGTDAENPVADFALVGEAGEQPEQPVAEKCIVVSSKDMVEAAWDTQFWVISNEVLHANDAVTFKADVKATKEAASGTQYHKEPGGYLHWSAVGNVTFTTEWATYEWSGTVPAEADGAQSIAFNLNDFADANDYYFKNISFVVNGVEMVNNGDLTGDDMSSFAVKIDRGGIETATASALDFVQAESVNTVSYNLFGQKTNATSGLMIRNGKVIMVK